MPTLRRILKYTPVVLLGLLALAWVVSIPFSMGIGIAGLSVGCDVGSLGVSYPSTLSGAGIIRRLEVLSSWLGQFAFYQWGGERYASVPIPIVLSLLFPAVLGPFGSFRFRLWHYLAYTLLVAVELAYYLRWQG